MGGVTAGALYEFCDGGKLVLCGGLGDVACVEEETEKGCLSGALTGDHERVPSDVAGEGIEGVASCSGVHAVWGEVVGVNDGGRGANLLAGLEEVGVVWKEVVVAVIDDERHGEEDVGDGGHSEGWPGGEAGAGMIKEGPQRSRASDTEPIGSLRPKYYLYRGSI